MTCPTSCPFNSANEGGCYAAFGPLALFWQKVSDDKAGGTYEEFLSAVSALPAGQLWRHNQAGDLPGAGDTIDAGMLAQLVEANRGKKGFGYTHKPVSVAGNAAAITSANAGGLTINLSSNNLRHADELADAAVGPVVAVVPIDYARQETRVGKATVWAETLAEYRAPVAPLPSQTPAGRPIAVCPAVYRDNTSCASCGLCQRQDRKVVVAFPAHGASKRRADAIARG